METKVSRNLVCSYFYKTATLFEQLCVDRLFIDSVFDVAVCIADVLKSGKRIFIAGNGGSAADAQHFAAELVGYFRGKDDAPMSAIALTTDTSFLTAWGNDASFDDIFCRQLKAHARFGDIFFAISTSGNSKNIINALDVAKDLNMIRIALLGRDGGEAGKPGRTYKKIIVPYSATSQIQEVHIATIHAICHFLK